MGYQPQARWIPGRSQVMGRRTTELEALRLAREEKRQQETEPTGFFSDVFPWKKAVKTPKQVTFFELLRALIFFWRGEHVFGDRKTGGKMIDYTARWAPSRSLQMESQPYLTRSCFKAAGWKQHLGFSTQSTTESWKARLSPGICHLCAAELYTCSIFFISELDMYNSLNYGGVVGGVATSYTLWLCLI